MDDEKKYRKLSGEVAGSFLLGLTESFSNLYVIATSGLNLQLPAVEAGQWYPFDLLIDTLRSIEKTIPAFKDLFFRAGMNFLRIWYEQGPGKDMIRSTTDWLYANQYRGGYNSVVRGGKPEEIGWCRLLRIDIAEGIAVYENVTPLLPDYVLGVFYGGCVIFDDVDYVDVSETHESFDASRAFYRITLTVRFRLKPVQDFDAHTAALQRVTPDGVLSLRDIDTERLVWQYKSLAVRAGFDAAWHNAIGMILERAVKTILKQNEAIALLSNTDALTGIANVRVANERLQVEHARAVRNGSRYGILFIDLDGFKEINDAWGHLAGDFVLKTVALRAFTCVRCTDTLARKGGDEFLIILPDLKQTDDALVVARKVRGALQRPIYFEDQEVSISASVGIALFPEDGGSPEEIVNNADKAMYWVKRHGKDGFKVFAPDLD
jgi:diguanylate cyclase (GGDEF)-like protein